jgi:hypothetical protein
VTTTATAIVRRVPLLLAALLLACPARQASSGPGVTSAALAGDWVGGYRIGKRYSLFELHLPARADVRPSFDLPAEGVRGATLTDYLPAGDALRFTLPGRRSKVALQGRLDHEALIGAARAEGQEGSFEMRRTTPVEPGALREYMGLYDAGAGHLISFERMPELAQLHFVDFFSGRFNAIFPEGKDRFFAGLPHDPLLRRIRQPPSPARARHPQARRVPATARAGLRPPQRPGPIVAPTPTHRLGQSPRPRLRARHHPLPKMRRPHACRRGRLRPRRHRPHPARRPRSACASPSRRCPSRAHGRRSSCLHFTLRVRPPLVLAARLGPMADACRHTRAASARSCVTNTRSTSRAAQVVCSTVSACICARLSSAAVGSSTSRTAGRHVRASASATRWA